MYNLLYTPGRETRAPYPISIFEVPLASRSNRPIREERSGLPTGYQLLLLVCESNKIP